MLPNFSKHKARVDAPDQLFFYLDKIISICLIKIERGEIKSARSILKDLELFLNKFWTLKQINPGRFLSLISTPEIYENACPIKIPGHFYEMDSFDAQCADNLKVQTLLLSQLQSGKEIKGFNRLLAGFGKIWEKAFLYEQQEITTAIFQVLDHFLKTLLSKPFNDLFIETVLRVYLSIFERLQNTPDKSMVEYEMRGALLWYQKYQLNRASLINPFEDFGYEDLLDQTIYRFIMIMVTAKQETSLEIFVNLLAEKTDILSRSEHSLLDFFHILEKGSRTQFEEFKQKNFYLDTIEKLNLELDSLDSLPKIRTWISKEEKLLAQIRPFLEVSQIPHFNDVEKDIYKYLQFLLRKQKILEIIDVTIAYGLARNKTFIIKSIFAYHLPYDNFHTWFDEFILPKTRCELLLFLNRKQKTIAKYNVSEGMKIHEAFYEKSSLLIISSFLLRSDPGMQDSLDVNCSLSLTESGSTLTSVRYILSTLLVATHGMAKDQNFCKELGVPDDLAPSHWKDKVFPFLEFLSASIDQKVIDLKTEQKVSTTKLNDFKMAIWVNYKNNAVLRTLFNIYQPIITDDSKESEMVVDRVGLNVIDEKSQFLENWDNTCSLQMIDYGLRLAYSEDLFVFNEIHKNCTFMTWKQLEQNDYSKINHDYLMVATDLSYQSVLLKNPNFSPDWTQGSQERKNPFHVGRYEIDNQSIPVVVIQRIKDEEGILLLDKNHMGKWVQYSPLNPGEDERLKHEFLYINAQAFSEKHDLMEEFLNHPPAWLREIGPVEKQKNYLLEHILIHIFERFQWKPTLFSGAFSLEDSF
jgi:hypothetical protein